MRRTRLGWHCSHELASPRTLREQLRGAEQAGFGAAMCSDHFMPWSERDAQSGFAWSWLGAALQASALSLGTVCAPGQRYHPAVIAQAAATLAEMFPDRLWLAIGSGEALNEHVTGEPWPDKARRNARLRECADVMRALWAGERVDHAGLVTVRDAKLYTLPERPPLLLGAALSPETARWLGGWADGLITAGSDPASLRKIMDAFRDGGGDGKPTYLQTALAFADTPQAALEAVHRRWRHCTLDRDRLADLPTPWAFDAATARVSLRDVATCFRTSTSGAQVAEWLSRDLELGFERVYVHNVAPEQTAFLEACATTILPALER